MQSLTQMDGAPLAGVRVLDLSRLLPGPFATLVLADLGAQVDKLEPPGVGDRVRQVPPFDDEGESVAFRMLHRGKRSIALDLKQAAGAAAFRRLVRGYDVLVESFRPGVMESFGLSAASLRAESPGLIYCSLTGYGQQGVLASRAGHDLNFLARSGVLGLTGPAGSPPQAPGAQIADVGGALYAVIAILAALRDRDLRGRGSVLDIALTDAALTFSLVGLSVHAGGVHPPRGEDVLMGGIAAYGTYLSSDGRALALAALEPKFWQAFCDAVGIEAAAEALLPGEHQREWKARLEALFGSRTFEQWQELARENDCCIEPVLSPEEVFDDLSLQARGLFDRGVIRTPVAPTSGSRAPALGADTDAILLQAGFDAETIGALRAQGAVA